MGSAGKLRVATYLRVSSDVQSVAAQREEIVGYIERWGARQSLVRVAEYQETISTGKRQRPELLRMLAAARAREFDVLVVAGLDRVGRSLSELVQILEVLRELDVMFITVREGHNTGTAAGRALFGMAAVFADYERTLIQDRTKAGMAAARAQGRFPGRPSLVRARVSDADMLRALASHHGNQKRAAASLEVSPSWIRKRLKLIKAAAPDGAQTPSAPPP